MAKTQSRKAKPAKGMRQASPLTPRQKGALAALLGCPTVRAAALEAGVPESTLYDWLALDGFQAALQDASERAFRRSVVTLKRHCGTAIDRLVVEMAADAPHMDRVAVADKILSHALRFFDAVEMRAKVEKLEAMLGDSGAMDTQGRPAARTGNQPPKA